MDKKVKRCVSVANYLRHRQHMTINELSKAADVSGMTISRIENGLHTMSIHSVMNLARYFGVPVHAILTNDFSQVFSTFEQPVQPEYQGYTAMEQVNAVRLSNGKAGEQWVYELECEKLRNTFLENAVNPFYSDDKDAHFDLLSFDYECHPILIEVKSTSLAADEPFELTDGELALLKNCVSEGIRYELHRVYYVNCPKRRGRMIIPGEVLLQEYEFNPNCYTVKKKVS